MDVSLMPAFFNVISMSRAGADVQDSNSEKIWHLMRRTLYFARKH